MNILLTSAGRRTYLINYFKSALAGKGKVFASNSVFTYTLTQADGYAITPQIYDREYIDFLLQYCSENGIGAVISLFDIDLPVLSAARERFKGNNIELLISSERAISICNDKWKTYLFLKECNIATPKSYIKISEARTALEEGTIHFPLFIKPRWGMGSIGIYKIENSAELEVLYEKLRRQIFETYLKFESSEDSENCIIIQEAIAGDEYGLEVLNDLKGNYVTTLSKHKLAMRSGETDIAEIVDNKEFEPIGQTLSHNLGHIANLDVDCFKTKDGTIYVLEMNCRFGGQYPFSHLAGVDFPAQIVEWLNGGKTCNQYITPRVGTIACKDLLPVVMV